MREGKPGQGVNPIRPVGRPSIFLLHRKLHESLVRHRNAAHQTQQIDA